LFPLFLKAAKEVKEDLNIEYLGASQFKDMNDKTNVSFQNADIREMKWKIDI